MTRNVVTLLLLALLCASPLCARCATDPYQQLYRDIDNIAARKQACDSAVHNSRWSDVVTACGFEERDFEHSAGDELHRIAYFQKVGRSSDADSELRSRNLDLLFAAEYGFYVAIARMYQHDASAVRRSAYHVRELLASVNPSVLKQSDRIEGDTHLYQRYVSLRQHTDAIITSLRR